MARPRQVSDTQILDVARETFLELGPGVSTKVIAERVGVSQAAVFKRFGTKEQLMLAALVPFDTPPWIATIDEGPDGRPLRDQLVEISGALMDFFEAMVPCYTVLRSSGTDLHTLLKSFDVPPPVRGLKAMSGWFGRCMDQGRMVRRDSVAVSGAFIGAMQARQFMRHVIGPHLPVGSDEDYIGALVDTFLGGLER